MEKAGTKDIPVAETPEIDALRASLDAFDKALQDLPENVLLKDCGALSAQMFEKQKCGVS